MIRHSPTPFSFVTSFSLSEQLDDDTYEKLFYALSAMVRLEPFIALMDVCQLDKKRGKEIMKWAVRTLVKAATEA